MQHEQGQSEHKQKGGEPRARRYVRMIETHFFEEAERRQDARRPYDQDRDSPCRSPDEFGNTGVPFPRIRRHQAIEPPTCQQRDARLQQDQVIVDFAREPKAWKKSVQPAVERRELPPAQKEVNDTRESEELRLPLAYEKDSNQRQEDDDGPRVHIGAGAEIWEYQRKHILRSDVRRALESRVGNSVIPSDRLPFTYPTIDMLRPFGRREPLQGGD